MDGNTLCCVASLREEKYIILYIVGEKPMITD